MCTRRAQRADADEIRAIYNREVTQSTVTFDMVPRTFGEQLAWIDEHSGAHPAIVALDADVVVGFAAVSPYRSRPGYSTTVEESVYVADDHQGRGIGRLLLTEIVELARIGGFHAVIARIVGDHEASIGLHRVCGFEMVGIEREVGRKFGRWLDVAVMELLL